VKSQLSVFFCYLILNNRGVFRTLHPHSRGTFNITFRLQQYKTDDLKFRIEKELEKTGERERLLDVLRARLIECGWRDVMKDLVKKEADARGIDNIDLEQLAFQLFEQARDAVPEEVKIELMGKLKAFADKVVS